MGASLRPNVVDLPLKSHAWRIQQKSRNTTLSCLVYGANGNANAIFDKTGAVVFPKAASLTGLANGSQTPPFETVSRRFVATPLLNFFSGHIVDRCGTAKCKYVRHGLTTITNPRRFCLFAEISGDLRHRHSFSDGRYSHKGLIRQQVE